MFELLLLIVIAFSWIQSRCKIHALREDLRTFVDGAKWDESCIKNLRHEKDSLKIAIREFRQQIMDHKDSVRRGDWEADERLYTLIEKYKHIDDRSFKHNKLQSNK